MKLRSIATIIAAGAVAATAGSAGAFSTGVQSSQFGIDGCNSAGCHGVAPGTIPTVTLSGPTTVTEGSINEYTLTITSPPGQPNGGLNVVASDGTLSVGGTNSTSTKIIGPGEITHSASKAGDGTEVLFSFLWEAPLSAGTTTIDAWGNAVNGAAGAAGDGAALSELEITVESAAPPFVPATSPWGQAGLIALLLAAGSWILRRRSSFV